MRYPRMLSPPLTAKGRDVRDEDSALPRGLISVLENAYRNMLTNNQILGQWSASQLLPNTAVASWVDEINGLTLVQATPAMQPIMNPRGLDDTYPALMFDGVNDYLRGTTLTGLPSGTVAGAAFLVGTKSNLADPSAIDTVAAAYGGATAGGYRAVGKHINFPQIGDGTKNAAGTTVPWEAGAIVVGIFDPVVYTLRFNGLETAVAAAATLNTTATNITVGADTTVAPAKFWAGGVSQYIVTGQLTLDQVIQLEGWLAVEYGLTSSLDEDHPFTTKVVE